MKSFKDFLFESESNYSLHRSKDQPDLHFIKHNGSRIGTVVANGGNQNHLTVQIEHEGTYSRKPGKAVRADDLNHALQLAKKIHKDGYEANKPESATKSLIGGNGSAKFKDKYTPRTSGGEGNYQDSSRFHPR